MRPAAGSAARSSRRAEIEHMRRQIHRHVPRGWCRPHDDPGKLFRISRSARPADGATAQAALLDETATHGTTPIRNLPPTGPTTIWRRWRSANDAYDSPLICRRCISPKANRPCWKSRQVPSRHSSRLYAVGGSTDRQSGQGAWHFAQPSDSRRAPRATTQQALCDGRRTRRIDRVPVNRSRSLDYRYRLAGRWRLDRTLT